MSADPAYHEGRKPFTGKPQSPSQLPTFKVLDKYVTAIGPDNKRQKVAEVQCQRKACMETFVVTVKAYKQDDRGTCPYCFKASWRPSSL
jgi:hypothetical protein